MGLHWATEVERPLPLVVVDELRSSRRAVARGRVLLARLARVVASPARQPRLAPQPVSIGARSLRIAR
jgi:hypothetical protein